MLARSSRRRNCPCGRGASCLLSRRALRAARRAHDPLLFRKAVRDRGAHGHPPAALLFAGAADEHALEAMRPPAQGYELCETDHVPPEALHPVMSE
jgi:hypothetical protein